MAASDAKPVPVKNTAYRVTFPIYDADGDLVTGATGLDSEVSKDGGTFADCTNEATEIATSSGVYYLDLTSTEMNADTVAIIVKTSSSGAKTTIVVLNPQEAGDIKVDVETISDDATAASNAEAFFDGTGYAGTNNVIPTVTSVTNAVTLPSSATINITGNLSGSVGSVTGNVGGNVSGSVGSISGVTFPSNFASLGINASGHITRVVLCDTITTYTGDTPQTGDSFARIGANGSGLTSLAPAATALSTATWTGTRAGYLDNLSGGAVALQSTLLTVAGYLDTEVAAILEDTGTTIPSQIAALSIPSASTNASAVRTELATELALIDVATSTRLATASYTAPLDAAGVRSAVGLAAANLDMQLTALNGYVDCLPATLDGSTLTSIPWNAAWDAEVQSEVADALAVYDPPTNTEMEARTLAAASYATASTLATVAADVVLILADTGTDGVVLSSGQCNAIADHVLRRNQSNVEASSNGDTLALSSVYGAVQQLQEASASGTTLTVKKTDGSTTLGTKTLATDAAADPVTGVS